MRWCAAIFQRGPARRTIEAMRACAWLLSSLVLFGCDDGSLPPPPPVDAGPRTDAGRRDAGGDVDADVAADSGTSADAGVLACTTSDDLTFKLASDSRVADRTVALAAGADSFALLWNELRDARPDLFGVRVSSEGALGAVQRITDNTSVENFPALAAAGTAWIASYTDNTASTGYELYTRALAADAAPAGAARPITATAMRRDDDPSLFEGTNGLLLAWVEDDATALTRTARAVAVGDDGAPAGAAQTASAAGARPGALALGELASGPVAVWAQAGELALQRLMASGAVDGAPTLLSANASGGFDAALRPSGGAVVFGALAGGARSEVRFRAVSSSGALLGDERILAEGADPSIAPFAGGYAVSYRAPEASTELTHAIRLLFVNEQGDVVSQATVAGSLPTGGRTTVRVSGDGQIGVAWADRDVDGTDILLSIVRCQ
jgi:hypothetical protein